MLDVTASTGPLAKAAARLCRLLPARAGVLLRGDRAALRLAASDGELSAWFEVPAGVAGAGEVGVARRGLAETLAGLDAPEVRLAGRAETVVVRADADLFGLTWPGGGVVSATLGGAYPDVHLDRLLEVRPECVVEADADALAGAVERAARYGGEHGRVTVQVGDGALVIRASDPLAG